MPTSKSKVDKAGKRWSKYRQSGRTVEDLDTEEMQALVDALDVVDAFRAEHAAPLRSTNANLRWYVGGYGEVSVTQRLKKFPTVLDKLQRHPGMALSRMEDIGGLRAVLPSQAAVDEVARRLKKNWNISRSRDYVREPKESGYRAVHLVTLKRGVCIEVQLRTFLQDAWANQVEHDSRHLRTDFKSGRGAAEVHRYYVAVSEMFALRESDAEAPESLRMELGLSYAAAKPYLASANG